MKNTAKFSSKNDYMGQAADVSDTPSLTVQEERGNNSGPVPLGNEKGKAEWEGDGSYASGFAATKRDES